MKKILIITEHLSTGGLPQYILKKIELVRDVYDIYVIECNNFSNTNIVQRNKIKLLIDNKLIHLYNETESLDEIIKSIKPDVIWFEEIAEYFLQDDILDKIWNNKNYKIIESSHTSNNLNNIIRHIPDMFILVSPYQNQFYEKFNVPITIIDYPVEVKERNKKEKQKELRLDINKYHVLQIGLFAPHKNQSYTFELAKLLVDYPIEFHFIGNMSENFQNYFEPLLKNQPGNCSIYGEINNVDDYIQAADLIIHPSTAELNPLTIKEALQYDDLPILISNIETHKELYILNEQIYFLTGLIKQDIKVIKDIFFNVEIKELKTKMTNKEFKNEIIKSIESFDNNMFKIDLNDGVTVIIDENAPDIDYKIEYLNNKNELVFESIIKRNMWCATSAKFYVDYTIKIKNNDTNELLKEFNTSLENKVVKIIIDSKSLGDTLAWMPYAEEFRQKHNCELYLLTFHNNWFENQYPDINFVWWDTINTIKSYATYKIGWYYDNDNNIDYTRNPNNFRIQPMQKTPTDILGLDYKEIKPKLNINKKPTKRKKVGIAVHSTSQVKYWNREGAWQEVVDFLNNNGFEVILYSRENDGYMGNPNPKNVEQFPQSDILTLAEDLSECEFFIGLPSGLSWLAWTVDVPVILISGTTDGTEFFNNDKIYVGNEIEGADKHCFNKARMDPGDWNWCPCEPKFSCSSNIEVKQVIDAIQNNFMVKYDANENEDDFDWGWFNTNDKLQKEQFLKELYEFNIYEKFFEVEEGDVVLDIGASVGPFTKSIIDKNPSKVICVEPSSAEFPTLVKNFRSNINVLLVNAAIGSENKSGVENKEIYGDDKLSEQITFKSLLDAFNLNKIDFLKIDCEGGEYDIFTKENLSILKEVPKIVMEVHLRSKENKEKFRNFRDNILSEFSDFEVYSLDGVNIKWDLYNEHFIEYYNEVMFYFKRSDIIIDNTKVYVSKSKIHGWGVFAKQKINKDEIIEICPFTEINLEKDKISSVLVDYRFNYPSGSNDNWQKQVVVFGYGSLYNHSDDNNAYWYSEGDVYKFIANRDIDEGEEILVYYGDENYWNSRKHINKNR